MNRTRPCQDATLGVEPTAKSESELVHSWFEMETKPSPGIDKLNVLLDPILANTPVLEEYRSHFPIRCKLDIGRFAQVISSVTSRSVLFFGVVTNEIREATGTEAPVRMIAMITLPESVRTDQTVAVLEDEEVVLTLVKTGPPLSTP
jgi:hypothetical protein